MTYTQAQIDKANAVDASAFWRGNSEQNRLWAAYISSFTMRFGMVC